MIQQKPSLPKGTRDFDPNKMIRRDHIFTSIKDVFKKYGFLPIETPAVENLSVLTGKYGDEGDQLIFKILNSGDFLSGLSTADLTGNFKPLIPKISEKALRYDLTVPFARFVVMNRNDIVFPFKRYQIQPVWRADRPQKGRYREFFQCDADVVGTNSLLCEAEIISMISEVFAKLGLQEYLIKINNRKILTGITEIIDKAGCEGELCVAIDKLDKIGLDGVLKELREKNFSDQAIEKLLPVFDIKGSNSEKLKSLGTLLKNSAIGMKGIQELEEVFNLSEKFGYNSNVELDITLARGLSYYTGAIFEVKALNVQMGSICGGGRYDNLTGLFGLPNISGVGISFGVDRIYDVLDELNLFPDASSKSTQVLIGHFDQECMMYGIGALNQLRKVNIAAELYPDISKIKKQMEYADKKRIPFVIIIGSDEMKSGKLTLKELKSGEQSSKGVNDIIKIIQDSY